MLFDGKNGSYKYKMFVRNEKNKLLQFAYETWDSDSYNFNDTDYYCWENDQPSSLDHHYVAFVEKLVNAIKNYQQTNIDEETKQFFDYCLDHQIEISDIKQIVVETQVFGDYVDEEMKKWINWDDIRDKKDIKPASLKYGISEEVAQDYFNHVVSDDCSEFFLRLTFDISTNQITVDNKSLFDFGMIYTDKVLNKMFSRPSISRKIQD